MTACKSIGYQVFRLNTSCKCSCHEIKTSTELPYFKWKTNGTTMQIPKTFSPKVYHVVGTLSPATIIGITDNDNVDIECSPKKESTSTSSLKLALRYGFHQTSECKVFEKAFLCMQKCIVLNYDVAFSDKYCFCTCYVNKDKARYFDKLSNNSTKWKYGVPTTSKPAWAQKYLKLSETTTSDSADQEMETNTSSVFNFTETIVGNDIFISSTATPNNSSDVFTNETLSDNGNTTRAESLTTGSDVDNTNSSNVTVSA
ncbi:unnamed protein product, partial [Brenthis ino]